MRYPGQDASQVVRVIGVLTVLVGAIVALWLVTEMSSALPPDSAGIITLAALMIFLNGLVAGSLLVVFAAIGENLIGIRQATEVSNALLRGRGGERVRVTNAAAEEGGCTHCGSPLKEDAKFCTNCGTRIDAVTGMT